MSSHNALPGGRNLDPMLLVHPLEQCPACSARASSARPLFSLSMLGEPCHVVRCAHCGLVFKDRMPTAAGLTQMYAHDYEHFSDRSPISLAERTSLVEKLVLCRRLLGGARSPSEIRVLDVGCASGRFVQVANQVGFSAEGIDPYLPEELEGATLRRCRPEDLPSRRYDVVTLLNVLEHADEPTPLLAAVRRLVAPGGVLLATCPYGDSLARRVHGARWNHAALDQHLLFWTPRSLELALRRAGFAGRCEHRIAGSPFPCGRTAPGPTAIPTFTPGSPESLHTDAAPVARGAFAKVQDALWSAGRRIQALPSTARVVRKLVHGTRTGDYLEFAVRGD